MADQARNDEVSLEINETVSRLARDATHDVTSRKLHVTVTSIWRWWEFRHISYGYERYSLNQAVFYQKWKHYVILNMYSKLLWQYCMYTCWWPLIVQSWERKMIFPHKSVDIFGKVWKSSTGSACLNEGAVGSGKTSLLLSILGENYLEGDKGNESLF